GMAAKQQDGLVQQNARAFSQGHELCWHETAHPGADTRRKRCFATDSITLHRVEQYRCKRNFAPTAARRLRLRSLRTLNRILPVPFPFHAHVSLTEWTGLRMSPSSHVEQDLRPSRRAPRPVGGKVPATTANARSLGPFPPGGWVRQGGCAVPAEGV